jgi:hypothetical protein
MRNRYLVIIPILILVLSSCSLFPTRVRERKIQTEIISKISGSSDQLAKCSKESDLFNKMKIERIRVLLYISINSKGQIEKFKLDDKQYPDDFSECVFKIVDLINFPKIQNNELIELEQPFIFSKK